MPNLVKHFECAVKWVFTFTLHENLPLIMFFFWFMNCCHLEIFKPILVLDFRFIQQDLEDIWSSFDHSIHEPVNCSCSGYVLVCWIDNAQKTSKLDGADVNVSEGPKIEKTENQKRLGLTGYKPSDDEVSFSLQNLELQTYGNCIKGKDFFLFVWDECLYNMSLRQLLVQ